ncbi:MAG: hypothetical protein JXA60_07115 [Candidatus Coatesbacteria bacterium]|nr:hypothetical protein [Candidatus Coatesbacteria bacterium]
MKIDLLKPDLFFREILNLRAKQYKLKDINPDKIRKFRPIHVIYCIAGFSFLLFILFLIIPIPDIKSEENVSIDDKEDILSPEVKVIEIEMAKAEGLDIISKHIEKGEFEEAYKEIREFIRIFPDDTKCIEYKKMVLKKLIKNVDKILRTAKNKQDYGRAYNRYLELYALTKDPLALNGMTSVINLIAKRAQGYLAAQKYQDAFEWATYAKHKEPNNKAVNEILKQLNKSMADLQIFKSNPSKFYELEHEVIQLANQVKSMQSLQQTNTPEYVQILQKYIQRKALLDRARKFISYRGN